MEVGEEFWWKIELTTQCVSCKPTMEVMLDSILGGTSTSQQAGVGGPKSLLVSPVCAPPVPKCTEHGSADPWGSQLL